MARELAVELGEERHAVGKAKFGAGRRERGVLRRRRAVDDEARARKRLERGSERRVAHPVVRPGDPGTERKYSVGVKSKHAVEAGAEFAPGITASAGIVGKREAAAVGVGLAVARRAEALHLNRGIGRNAAVDCGEAIAALDPPAIALRVEARGEMVAGKREAVARHPVIDEGERRGEIGWPRARRAVDARLERVALAGTEPCARLQPVPPPASARPTMLLGERR